MRRAPGIKDKIERSLQLLREKLFLNGSLSAVDEFEETILSMEKFNICSGTQVMKQESLI